MDSIPLKTFTKELSVVKAGFVIDDGQKIRRSTSNISGVNKRVSISARDTFQREIFGADYFNIPCQPW
jgi:hypothetical protein